MARLRSSFAVLGLLLTQSVLSISLTINDENSVKKAAKTVAAGLMDNYVAKEAPFLLPYPPYFWWESGAMWGVMLDYWHTTGDTTYNSQAMTAIQSQVGDDKDFMPVDQTFTMGNDDQAFWALTALTAAETNFENPPKGSPSWLGLAQAVFNEQVGRWDDTTCGGGLHWQAYSFNGGYALKNTISNGALMQVAARLARYTRDDKYAKWATKLWDWMWDMSLIDHENYNVYDNVNSDFNCSIDKRDKSQWSYNAATLIVASATMYNYTDGAPIWKNRVDKLLTQIIWAFFQNNVMTELCESTNGCNIDERTFKAYLSRWLALTVQMAPHTSPIIRPLLKNSAVAAMKQCSGTFFPNNCGLKWYMNSTWDGTNGPGEQMAALGILISTIIPDKQSPLTNLTGGTSISDPTAGRNRSLTDPGSIIPPATQGDKVGAWFLTAVIVIAAVAGCYFLWSPSLELRPGNLQNGLSGSKGGFFSSLNFGSGVEKSSTHAGGLMSPR